jgi:hypothetical protein
MALGSRSKSTSPQRGKKATAGIESAFVSLELVVLNYVFNGDPKWIYGRAEYISGYLGYFPRIFPSTNGHEVHGELAALSTSKPYPPEIVQLSRALLKFENEAESYIREGNRKERTQEITKYITLLEELLFAGGCPSGWLDCGGVCMPLHC